MNAFKQFNSFEEGAKEIASMSKNILEVLAYQNQDIPTSSDEAAINIAKYVIDHAPSIYDEYYPSSSAFSIKATEVGYKCPGHLAFGWRVFIGDNDEVTYNFRITINNGNNTFAKNTAIMKMASAFGWRLEETKKPMKRKYNNNNEE